MLCVDTISSDRDKPGPPNKELKETKYGQTEFNIHDGLYLSGKIGILRQYN